MAGRRTNLGLLWGTAIAVITGFAAFMIGTPSGQWVVVAHGVIALLLVVLSPPKTTISRRGFLRARTGRWVSVALTAFSVVTVVSGVLLVLGITRGLGPFTNMQVHVTAGVATLLLASLHAVQRPNPLRRTDLSRRAALRAGGTLAAAGGLWVLTEGALELFGAPGSDRRFTGSHEVIDADAIPVTQWLNDKVEHLDATHEVRVLGTSLTAADLTPRQDIEATLDCTGGWYTTQVWGGVPLERLLGRSDGLSIVVRSTTGYWRRFPRDQAGDLWLVTHLAGRPLRAGHGGPVRLVAPGRRGYWWVKWISSVEVDDFPPWWQPPLPLA